MLLSRQRLHTCGTLPSPTQSQIATKLTFGKCDTSHISCSRPFRSCGTSARASQRNHRALSVEATAAPSEAGAPKIRIKLKSYWKHMLSDAVEHIKEAATSTNASFSGPVYLPTRRKIFTVLTSPHVNKDAREQFEIRTHSRLMDIKDLTPETIDRLMFLELPSGVNVEVKL